MAKHEPGSYEEYLANGLKEGAKVLQDEFAKVVKERQQQNQQNQQGKK